MPSEFLAKAIRYARMSTRPEYTSGRGPTRSDLDSKRLETIYQAIRKQAEQSVAEGHPAWNASRDIPEGAPDAFVRMVASIHEASATAFLVALYKLEGNGWVWEPYMAGFGDGNAPDSFMSAFATVVERVHDKRRPDQRQWQSVEIRAEFLSKRGVGDPLARKLNKRARKEGRPSRHVSGYPDYGGGYHRIKEVFYYDDEEPDEPAPAQRHSREWFAALRTPERSTFGSDRLKTTKDGVEHTVHSDGSAGFHLLRDGVKRWRVNERLTEGSRRNGRATMRKRPVGVCETATTLKFKQQPGGYIEGKPRDYAFWAIDSDIGRAHLPQKWATGFLPLIPPECYERWVASGFNRDCLEFNIPDDLDARVAIAKSYVRLFMDWGGMGGMSISTTQTFRRLLNNLGLDLDSKRVRRLLDELVMDGHAKLSRTAYSPDFHNRQSNSVRRYHPTDRKRMSFDAPFEERRDDELEHLRSLYAPFESYLKVGAEASAAA